MRTKKIKRHNLSCHSCGSRNPRHNPAKQKRDARFGEHDNEKCLLFQPWTGITWLTTRTHPQPLPLVNGWEKEITKLAYHSCPEQESPTHPDKIKNEMPAYAVAHKFASMTWKNVCFSSTQKYHQSYLRL